MILAQVFASLSKEGAIKVVICLLDAIKLIHFSQFLFDHREVYVFIFWHSSGVGKDTSNALYSIIISKNAVTSTNYPIITLIHYTLLKHSCIVSNLNDGFCSFFERHTKKCNYILKMRRKLEIVWCHVVHLRQRRNGTKRNQPSNHIISQPSLFLIIHVSPTKGRRCKCCVSLISQLDD